MPVVMDADRIGRTLARIAHEILERNKTVDDLALVGVRRRGVPLARRLATTLRELSGHEVPTGALDITLYRDDLMRPATGPQPVVGQTDITFSLDDRRILLVDDVLFTGRTTRAAPDALTDFGRPKACSSTAGTASCRSAPTMSARTCRRRPSRACRCGSSRQITSMK